MPTTRLTTFLTYILVILFGSSSWISVNGAWIQLPLFVNVLPEKWTLPSYLTVTVQLAFIGPLVYTLLKKCLPDLVIFSNPTKLIYINLLIAFLSHLFLAIFWRYTSIWPDGVEHSTALFILFFFMSLVNCLSNVLYLPYMSYFQSSYTSAYFVGMGLSALIPSVLGLIQGAGRVECVLENITGNGSVVEKSILPLFSVAIFNWVICAWVIVVMVGFYCLNNLKMLESERHKETSEVSLDPAVTSETPQNGLHLSHCSFFYLLFIVAWICALMDGTLPSISSFSTLPYGQNTYHLSLTISNFANPFACFLTFFITVRRIRLVVTVWTLLGTLLTAYILMGAVWSPKALLGKGPGAVGPALMILAYTAVTCIWAYLRTTMASVLRACTGAGGNSESRLFWCGFFTQAGSFIGAIVMFPLVNVIQLFQQAPNC